MGLKSIVFVLVMIGAVGAPLMVEAQFLGGILKLIEIQGTVYCTADGNIGINGSATPIFPNAVVQLQCGGQNVVPAKTTDSIGNFSFSLNPIEFLLSFLTKSCNVVVQTPLSTCNATLPTGVLSSGLAFIGNMLSLTGFQFMPSP